jgi:phenylalanine-4-hydroxylase
MIYDTKKLKKNEDIKELIFEDTDYRNRRSYINELPYEIEYIFYNENEINTWNIVWKTIHPLYREHGCKTYLKCLKELIDNDIFKYDTIPQFKKVSDFMYKSTGFKLNPVNGLLSPLEFFTGLSKKIFFCTRYIRHHKTPFYTTEPDLIHEMLGHVPMFLNKEFCNLSQKIGELAIKNLKNIEIFERFYWYTIEFGLIKEDNLFKAYGAGILSSVDEMNKVFNNLNLIKFFDYEEIISKSLLITDLQNQYFYIDSFDILFELVNNLK